MTKTVDSIISKSIQEIANDYVASKYDYVEPRENPIATVPNDEMPVRKSADTTLFNFKAEHNGIQCIESLKPEDRGTVRHFWFSAKMLATVFDCADPKTVRSRIETLVNTGDLDVRKNFLTSQVPNSIGALHETTLYDLAVFNKLAMTFIDNPRAVEMRKAFNDVLVKHETQTPIMCLPQDYESALEALLAKVRENKALQAERDEALHAESLAKEASDQSFKARATAMGRLSNIADREYLAHMTETVCKKQLGILRDGRYKAEALLGTQWMRSCFKNEAYKSMRRWITAMASRRVTARLVSELSMKTGDASELRELYVEAKLYGVDFDTLAEERGFTDVRKAQKVLSSCVAVVDRYECNRGDGELKLCPICGYSPEIWGETLHVLANSPQVLKWLRDNTTVDELEWWIAEKTNENYGLPRETV